MARDEDDGFLSRWSRRKALVRQGVPAQDLAEPPAAEPAVAHPAPPAVAPTPASVSLPAVDPAVDLVAEPAPAVPAPTLAEAQALTPDDHFGRFVRPDVAPEVRNAALRQLFTDPHFNVMDGLDIYIDDYGRPDPIPESMLRLMNQSKALNLFPEEPPPETPEAPAPSLQATPTPETTASDEDPDLRLQPHDAAGPDGAEPSAVEDPGRQP